MATVTIRNLDDQLKGRLRLQAAKHNRSMEEEVRDILRTALALQPTRSASLAESIRARIVPLGGVELDLPPREAIREPEGLGG